MKPLLLLLFICHVVLAQHVSLKKKGDPEHQNVGIRKSSNVLINSRNFLRGKFVNRGIKGNPSNAKYYTAFAPIDKFNKVVNLPESFFFPSEHVLTSMNSKHRIKKVLPPYLPELLIRYKRSAGRSKDARKSSEKRRSRKIEIERTVKRREPRRVSRDRKGKRKDRKHRSRHHKRRRPQKRNQGRRKRSVDELNKTEADSLTPIKIAKRHISRQDIELKQKNDTNKNTNQKVSSAKNNKLARGKNNNSTDKGNTNTQVHHSRRRHPLRKSKKGRHEEGKRDRLKNYQKHKQNHKKNGRQRRFKKKNHRRNDGGQSEVMPSRRLIAAKDGHIEDYPYVVSIQKNGEHWCAGALLNQKIVVTTANCVWKSDGLSRLSVRAGSSYVNDGGQEAWVKEVMKHPKWSVRTNPDCDVALLLLDRTLRFSNTIHAADLPNRAMIPPFNDIFVTSWGADRRDGIYVREEKMIQVYHATLMNHQACNNITMKYGVAVTSNFFCAKQSGYRGPCTRDTGAPAVSDGVIWGLASWSIRKKCGTERFPSMYSYLGSDQNHNFLIMGMKRFMSDIRENPFLDHFPRVLYRLGNSTREDE